MTLLKINSELKNGDENFSLNNTNVDFQLRDFWRWNQSNLIENRTRGIVAEFIVKQALGIKNETRVEWDYYDLITDSGLKIEVKSAAYIQSWHQKEFSKINFGIAPTKGELSHPTYDGKYRRWSDFYIFCVLDCKDQETINPMNLNQWIFYVLSTKVLDDKIPTQKRIGLNSLLKLNPVQCDYGELKEAVK